MLIDDELHRNDLCCDDSARIASTQFRMMENDMVDVVIRKVESPMGEVSQVYDRDTAQYLGHIVVDEGYPDGEYICTRVDQYYHNPPNWWTNSYRDAKAFMARAMD